MGNDCQLGIPNSKLNFQDSQKEYLNFKIPNQLCSSGHQLDRFCNNDKCQSSAIRCGIKQCQPCHSLHADCSTLTLKQLNEKVHLAYSIQKKFVMNLFDIEQKIINKLIEGRKEFTRKRQSLNLESDSLKAFESIYTSSSDQSRQALKGKQIKALFNQLKQENKQHQADQYLELYSKQCRKNIQQLEKLRSNLIQNSSKSKSKSKILSIDKQGKEKYQFLMKQLQNPSSLKLLFRASQHNFDASKFHKYCDGFKDTVTIVRTEFGKTIAAYTPLKWNSPSDAVYVADNSKRSFLLQLELQQKMTLIQPQYAIRNKKDYGPIFGNGKDLKIADKCNQNQKSYSNFPSSYNCRGKYQNNQQSYSAFCGSQNGYNFRVLEYEVFAIVK